MPGADVSVLVTQAPAENEDQALWGAPAKPAAAVATRAEISSLKEPPATSHGAFICRCLWPSSKCPANSGKLDAVVPVEAAVTPAASHPEPPSPARTLIRPAPTAAAAHHKEPQLGPQSNENLGRKTLVLDLDETLVHSSFRLVSNADIVIVVELEGEYHHVFVRKRPGVDTFLLRVAQMYEVVVYTASMAKYANPLLDKLDTNRVVSYRLFREACTRYPHGYVKDLSRLGRPLKDVIIIDNSPLCYALQPANAIPIKTWRDDMADRELLDLIPILQSLAEVESIPSVLSQVIWTEDQVQLESEALVGRPHHIASR